MIPGLAGVVDVVGDLELAWEFLLQEWPFEDEAAAPLELLKAGRVDEMLGAAPGFGATFILAAPDNPRDRMNRYC